MARKSVPPARGARDGLLGRLETDHSESLKVKNRSAKGSAQVRRLRAHIARDLLTARDLAGPGQEFDVYIDLALRPAAALVVALQSFNGLRRQFGIRVF